MQGSFKTFFQKTGQFQKILPNTGKFQKILSQYRNVLEDILSQCRQVLKDSFQIQGSFKRFFPKTGQFQKILSQYKAVSSVFPALVQLSIIICCRFTIILVPFWSSKVRYLKLSDLPCRRILTFSSY